VAQNEKLPIRIQDDLSRQLYNAKRAQKRGDLQSTRRWLSEAEITRIIIDNTRGIQLNPEEFTDLDY